MPVTLGDSDGGDEIVDRLQADILRRWRETADQVAQTAAAIRERRLSLANTDDAIAERRERLRRRDGGRSGLADLEGLIDQDDSVWLSFLSRGLTAARSVGRVITRRANGNPERPVGSGVLIAPALLLTNNHVIETAEDAAGTGVELGYDYADDGSELPYDTYGFEPDRCFWTDEELDFTVVAIAGIDGTSPGEKYGVVPLIEPTGKALKAEALNVIHHPGGDRKRLSIRENRLMAADELWLRYTSDTRPGSSGAPVFNDQWEMVALHHGGLPMRDAEGTALSGTGQPWTRDMGEEAKAYVANEGARVSRIVRRLREAQPGQQQAKELIDQALQAGAHQ